MRVADPVPIPLMLAACGCHAPLRPRFISVQRAERAGVGGGGGGDYRIGHDRRRRIARRGRVASRARVSGSILARIGLDSQTYQTRDSSRLLWVGPVPGDIAEVEAYCRIFRAAEQLHSVVMKTLCNNETGECAVSYNRPSEDLPLLEEKVVAVLGCMIILINRGREEVLSGRSSFMNSFKISDASILDDRLPPLALFRGEMKRCCESLQVALANYLTPTDDRSTEIWRRLQRLKNACYDAGFSRENGHPCPTVFANWSPVYFSTTKSEVLSEDSEVAFWKGGQVTDEGLAWLKEKQFKTIVDMREESVNDKYYHSPIEEAVSFGEIEVVSLPVEIGTAPSMEQVEKFASLVSDPKRRPLYLHSQEGVNRTSAMVSRWSQFVSRSTVQFNLNGEPSNKSGDDLKLQDVTRSESGGTLSEEENDVQRDLSATHTLGGNGHLSYKHVFTNGNASSCGTNAAELESFMKFSVDTDPFKAQLPTGDIFSRKEMAHFFRSRNTSPKTYLRSQHRRFGKLPISVEAQQSPFQNNGTISDTRLSEGMQLGSSNGAPTIGAFSLKNDVTSVGNQRNFVSETSMSVNDSLNGISNGKSYYVTIEPENPSNLSNNSTEQIIPTPIKDSKRYDAEVSIDSAAEALNVIEGNMCASTTGVVRVQSRKKAEMFLVRTDGFSCTREKVTESSLAFTHPSTQQQMLMWKSPPKTVLLLKKLGQALMEEAKEVASFLYHQEKMNVLVEPDVHELFARLPGFGFIQTFYTQDTSDLHERVDLVACLGGDGVILHASNLFRGAVPPVVSFNLGSLGFLTSHSFEEYSQDLRAVIHGNHTMDGVYITLRMRLRCEIFRKGKALPGKVFDVLNEIVVDRGSNPYLSKIECYEHDHLITKVQGDGVIIATPTGSTAYSTAAGGSMVHPNVPCMLFTPICPHSLSFRPVILPDSAQLELKIPNDTRSNAWISFDGKRRQQLSRGDSVRICMSEHPLPTVNKSDQTADWFRSLIRCLNWNERLDQKAF